MQSVVKILAILTIGLMSNLAPHMAGAEDAAPAAPAPTAPAVISDAQKTAIEEIVRDLLIKKEPDIVIKAAQAMQQQQDAEAANKGQQAIATNREKIFNDSTAPVGGNPKGDVTVVEFFDYQCGYCKMAREAIAKLTSTDKNVKIIYKEFPILGPVSVQASKAALASVRQGKYQKFHDALLDTKDHLTEDMVYKIAKDVGLDVEKLKKDMGGDDISKIIQANLALAGEIGARGTPTFVISDQVYPGAMQFDQLQKVVEDARKSDKK